jgi:hypothetical protein
MKKALVAGATALGILLSAPGAIAEQKTISGAELAGLFPGSFLAVANGMSIKITARGNGTLHGQMQGYKDKGKWTLAGGRLCITWEKWLSGKTTCSMVVADNGWYRGSGVKFRKL